jgi:PKD repeat protein
MNKKIASIALGIALLAFPIIASAQSNSSNNASIIATLQQLIVTLTQELQQLIAAHNATTPILANQSIPGVMTASPTTGSAPLTVSFTNQTGSTVDFGDGANGCSVSTDTQNCFIPTSFTHTYTMPGTYTVTVGRLTPSGTLGTMTINVTGAAAGSSGPTCATFSNLRKGAYDSSSDGKVFQLQEFLGMPNVTGYYGAQTAIAYQNKCGNLGNAQPTYVAGMTKYTDSDFGFSFWYPSGWVLIQSAVKSNTSDGWYQGGGVVKTLIVSKPGVSSPVGVSIDEFVSSDGSITELGHTDSASPVGEDMKYFFDTSAGQWMFEDISGASSGLEPAGTIKPADITHNTVGGLHVFSGAARFGADTIVPLSASHFLVISTNAAGGDIDQRQLANTIVATNSAVAIPVSTAQQTATIQAEQQAYAGQ